MYRTGNCKENGATNEDEKVDLDSQGMSHFDISALRVAGTCIGNITELSLNYNSLSTLPGDFATALPRLQVLGLSGNDLKGVPTCIGTLLELRSLSANENEISMLPESLFQLPKLEDLHLMGNRLKHLPQEIGNLNTLRNLTLEDNQLCELPNTLGELEGLRTLEAAENNLEALPKNFGNLKNLISLNLSRNRLLDLPDSFGDLPSLQFLDLSNNCLPILTPRLAAASKCLIKLNVTENLLKVFPPWIGELAHIEEIYIGDNYINDELPDHFGAVSGNTLRHMDVGANYLDHLPSSMGQLRKVETLHFGSHILEIERRAFQNGNRIQHLPDSFGQMLHLRHLRLDENQLYSLPETFGDLRSLEYLDLGQNLIQELPASFCQLTSLKTCLLSKNNLERLPEDFGNLKSLEWLRINENLLRELPASFGQLMNLHAVDLVLNRLTEFPSCLNQLTKLTRAALHDNLFELDIPEVSNLENVAKYPEDGVHKFVRTTTTHPETKMTSALANAVKKGDSIWKSHVSTEQDMITATTLEDEESDTDMNCSFRESLIHDVDGTVDEPEDWDMEVEDQNPFSCDDIPIYKHTTKRRSPIGKDIVDFNFTPSDEHPSCLPAYDLDLNFEDGQFEDAD